MENINHQRIHYVASFDDGDYIIEIATKTDGKSTNTVWSSWMQKKGCNTKIHLVDADTQNMTYEEFVSISKEEYAKSIPNYEDILKEEETYSNANKGPVFQLNNFDARDTQTFRVVQNGKETEWLIDVCCDVSENMLEAWLYNDGAIKIHLLSMPYDGSVKSLNNFANTICHAQLIQNSIRLYRDDIESHIQNIEKSLEAE